MCTIFIIHRQKELQHCVGFFTVLTNLADIFCHIHYALITEDLIWVELVAKVVDCIFYLLAQHCCYSHDSVNGSLNDTKIIQVAI